MNVDFHEVRGYLAGRASLRASPVTYTQLARDFKSKISSDADVASWSDILNDVCIFEVERGGPMLTVMVVNEETNIPGDGFYDLATELGRYNGSEQETNRIRFFDSELERVYSHLYTENG